MNFLMAVIIGLVVLVYGGFLWLLAYIGLLLIILYLDALKAEKHRPYETEKLEEKVQKHYHALKRNLDKSIKINDYGAVVKDNRREAIEEFLQSVGHVREWLSEDDTIGTVIWAIKGIDEQLLQQDFDAFSYPENGHEFEWWVAENLNKFGWNSTVTQGSGDQGVDVVAEKHGIRVGIQCKLYSGNVGNKAVQEIIAARGYFDLDNAAVLTNSDYTKSARELAEKSNVHLLNIHDISRFDSIFFQHDERSENSPSTLGRWIQCVDPDDDESENNSYLKCCQRIEDTDEIVFVCIIVNSHVLAVAVEVGFSPKEEVVIGVDNKTSYSTKTFEDGSAIFHDISDLVEDLKNGLQLTLTFVSLNNEKQYSVLFPLEEFKDTYQKTFEKEKL